MKKFVFSLAILLSSQSLFSGEVQADTNVEEWETVHSNLAQCDALAFANNTYKCALAETEAVYKNNMRSNIYPEKFSESNTVICDEEFCDVTSIHLQKVGDYSAPTLVEKLVKPAVLTMVGGFTYGAAHLVLQPYMFDGMRVAAYKMMQSSGNASSFLEAMRNRLQDQAANAASFKAALEYSDSATTVAINLGLAAASKGLEVLQDVSPKALAATVSVAKAGASLGLEASKQGLKVGKEFSQKAFATTVSVAKAGASLGLEASKQRLEEMKQFSNSVWNYFTSAAAA